MWAERFGAAFPDVDDSSSTCSEQRVAADRPLARGERRRSCATRAGSTADGRVHLVERPDQIVPIVCGGLGSLHAIALPSFGESTMQSKPVVRAPMTMDHDAVAAAVDEVGRLPARRRRRSAAASTRTRRPRASTCVSCSTTSRAPTASSRPTMLRETIDAALAAAHHRRVRARARRSAPRVVATRADESARAGARWSRVYQSVLHEVVRRARRRSGHGLRRVLRARVPRARASRRTACAMSELQRADAPALQPARLQPAGAAHGGRRARRASTGSRRPPRHDRR